MAEDNVRIGDANAIFGIVDESWGLFSNVEVSYEGQKLQIQDGDSNTIGVEWYDLVTKITGTCDIKGAEPWSGTNAVGKSITLTLKDGTTPTIYLDSWKKAWSRGGLATYNFEGTYYPNLST